MNIFQNNQDDKKNSEYGTGRSYLALYCWLSGHCWALPDGLAMSERLDLLWQAEALISKGQYR